MLIVCSHYFKLFQVFCDINNFIYEVRRTGHDSQQLFNRLNYVTYCCVKPFSKKEWCYINIGRCI